MKGSYCYMAVLKARGGSFNAVGSASPLARSRFAPLFDIQPPTARQEARPRAYLDKKVHGIRRCWVPDRPVYLDAHDLSVDTMVDGREPVALVCEGLRAHGFRPVPVSGTESERGRAYVEAIGKLASRLGYGVCLRVERDDIGDAILLRDSVSRSVDALRIPIEQTDLLLDLEYVGKDSAIALQAMLMEALQVAATLGAFRNIIAAGGSVPEQLPKRDAGVVRREPRVELQAWSAVHTFGSPGTPIVLGDFGVISPRYVKPGKPVNVPARVRYTTTCEHILLRTARSGHADLCGRLVAMAGEYAGAGYSAGDQRMSLAAQGLASPGNPGMWVAGDLNHHLELVSEQVWQKIREDGCASRYALPEPQHYPWLQPVLIEG